MEELTVPRRFEERTTARVEELMDRALEAKLVEYEARLSLLEDRERTTQETVEKDVHGLQNETIVKLGEFSGKLDAITNEVKAVEQGLHREESAVEKIRQHEQDAVANVKKWEKKTIASVKRQLRSPKFLKKTRAELGSRKFKESLVKAIFRDKRLAKMLVDRAARETSAKLRKQKWPKVSSKLAKSVEKKVLKTVRPKVRGAARKAARKAAKKALKAAA